MRNGGADSKMEQQPTTTPSGAKKSASTTIPRLHTPTTTPVTEWDERDPSVAANGNTAIPPSHSQIVVRRNLFFERKKRGRETPCCLAVISTSSFANSFTQDLVTLESNKQSLAIVYKEGPEHLSQGGTVRATITPVA